MIPLAIARSPGTFAFLVIVRGGGVRPVYEFGIGVTQNGGFGSKIEEEGASAQKRLNIAGVPFLWYIAPQFWKESAFAASSLEERLRPLPSDLAKEIGPCRTYILLARGNHSANQLTPL